ncbi:hypothetical protein HBB16_00435 [Pseudonocardia sp. MCCB 268]|nr:hypothetical protein [Pseudonocardia cytotoxica]
MPPETGLTGAGGPRFDLAVAEQYLGHTCAHRDRLDRSPSAPTRCGWPCRRVRASTTSETAGLPGSWSRRAPRPATDESSSAGPPGSSPTSGSTRPT